MSLIKQYMSILNEDKNPTSSGVAVDNTGELDGAEKAKSFPKDSGPDAADAQAPVDGPHSEREEDSLPEPVKKESRNPFDLLYNRILAQEAFGDEDGESFNFEGEIEDTDADHDFESDLDSELEAPEGSEEHEEAEEEGLEAVLDHLKNAVATLEKLVSSAEEDVEEVEDETFEDNEEEGEEIPMAKEAVEAEELGHALVDQEKLQNGLNKNSSQQVKGAVPVSKKKAELPKGKKSTGKFEKLSGNPEELTSKSKQNANGVKAGEYLFNQ
jgi:hypothetical protein